MQAGAAAVATRPVTAPTSVLHSFDHTSALAHYDQAIARLELRFGASHPSLAGLHSSAAAELCELGRYSAAIVRAERAIALWTLGGADHALLDQARVILARARARARSSDE